MLFLLASAQIIFSSGVSRKFFLYVSIPESKISNAPKDFIPASLNPKLMPPGTPKKINE